MNKNTCRNQRSANQQGGIWALKLKIQLVFDEKYIMGFPLATGLDKVIRL